ncbi:ImmA/IrrE family metallo-endopeptidase [Pseudactinotalea sp. HY158]|nr:ImmA/IrrE family metallo-endopeptidase [Pseudactinotalea sp. HY158]
MWRDLGRRNGELTSGGLVRLNPRKPAIVQRCTLAHEMGHWWHGHDWTRDHDQLRDERQADAYAARLLISPAEYALAERLNPHPGAIAKELEVTRHLVEVWQRLPAPTIQRRIV